MENTQHIKTQLNLAMFNKQIKCTAVRVPNMEIKSFQKQFYSSLLMLPKFKACRPIENDDSHK